MLCRANFSTQRPHGRAAISAALRMLCRANSSTHRPPGRTLHKKRMPHVRVTSFFLFSYSSVRTGGRPYLLPPGCSAVPISAPSPHQHGCAAGASRFGRGVRSGGRPYLLPSECSAAPISTPSPHQHGCAAGASRFGRGVRSGGQPYLLPSEYPAAPISAPSPH